VSGTLSQQNDASLLPAYIMSLGFTLSLGRDGGGVYWPGSAFAMVRHHDPLSILTSLPSPPQTAAMGICSLLSHYRSHGSEVFRMTRRKPVPIEPPRTGSSQEELTRGEGEDLVLEDTLLPPPLQQP
jgi:hypothetical protein